MFQRQGLLSVMLSWSKVACHERNGVILSYHLYGQRNGEIVTKQVNASADMSSVTFSNTCPFLTYEYGIAAENAMGSGPNATLNSNDKKPSKSIIHYHTIIYSEDFDRNGDRSCFWSCTVRSICFCLSNLVLLLSKVSLPFLAWDQ